VRTGLLVLKLYCPWNICDFHSMRKASEEVLQTAHKMSYKKVVRTGLLWVLFFLLKHDDRRTGGKMRLDREGRIKKT